MTYQARLALAFLAGLIALAVACFAMFLITSAIQNPQYPDIIATQPQIQK